MKRPVLIMLMVSVTIAGIVSWFASPLPDGFERVAMDKGFLSKIVKPLYEIFPDYALPGGMNEFLSRGLAGVIGTVVVFGFVFMLGKLIARNHNPEK